MRSSPDKIMAVKRRHELPRSSKGKSNWQQMRSDEYAGKFFQISNKNTDITFYSAATFLCITCKPAA